MKCPHCNTGIYEAFIKAPAVKYGEVTARDGQPLAPDVTWEMSYQRCPECYETIIYLERRIPHFTTLRFMAHPSGKARPVPAEVPDPYRQDFIESFTVLPHSPKASAALSRRCLQMILRDKAGTKARDLFDQIEEIITSGKVPSHIADDLHAVRNIGNFAAHPMKSKSTGSIVDVEPGEAEWNLDVLDSLFDFYFVQPAISLKRKQELNKKLKDAGKPELP